MPPVRIIPQPGQESVWDYPRPPRVEPVRKLVVVRFGNVTLAETKDSLRVLETSHPPVYYLPREHVDMTFLVADEGRSFCEWKGEARYFAVSVGSRRVSRAAWTYPTPLAGFEVLRDHLAFYAGQMDACLVDGVAALPQPGGFYGGWITPDVVGPFKGEPGSWGW